MASAYKQAGVDIEAGYEAVSRMKKHVAKTMRPEVIGGLGSFGGMFDLSKFQMEEPVLVSGTDGVGTKLKLAFLLDQHDTIGIDAVAMCVNDVVVQGAEPLFFLDYIACGKAVPEKIEAIVKGVAEGCQQAGCALIGGETAEMPGMYTDGEYDIAGFTVGIADKKKLVTGKRIEAGDVLIGLASSGIHSNGYSLVRKIVFEQGKLDLNATYEDMTQPLGQTLLTPTRIYVKAILEALKTYDIKGMAHITGGGFIENVPRMLPTGIGAEIHEDSWPILPIFDVLQRHGHVEHEDMYNIFNMGIGMVVAVDAAIAEEVCTFFNGMGEEAYIIGKTVAGEGVSIK